MGLFKSLTLFYLICCSCAIGGIGKVLGNTDVNKRSLPLSNYSISNARIFRSSVDRFVDKLFDETDTNEDGMVSFDEAYVGCLLLYVRLNRRAPIPPPSREKFLRLFLQATDRNKSNELNLLDKEEYGHILKRILGRAVLRLTSHKIVTLIGAPLLTEMIVRSMASRKDDIEATVRFIVPSNFHDAVIPTVTSKTFQRGFFMIILVMTLGNSCLAAVTLLLDMSLPKTQSVDW
jgi:hypothetical protein